MPNQIIKDGQIQEDSWRYVFENSDSSDLPSGDLIISKALWESSRDELQQRAGALGLLLHSDDEPESIAAELDSFDLVAVDFPAFTDGRAYSTARLLRERYGYQGDIRAVGDVLQDQLHFMTRCGFSSFVLKDGKDLEEALAGLSTISDAYQAGVDKPEPLYRRR